MASESTPKVGGGEPSADASEVEAVAAGDAGENPGEDSGEDSGIDSGVEAEPLRVLVTGFNDWRDLGEPPNIWRCRDNPSCRLLLGEPRDVEPDRIEGGPLLGELARLGRVDGREIEWNYATLPVTWGAAESIELRGYDVVIHLGLGVYDRDDQILVERGAFNLRRGNDAAGFARDEAIEAERGLERAAPAELSAALERVNGKTLGGYEVEVKAARESNSYLCNETHYRALVELEAARAAGERLRQVHFVHIPYARGGDYAALARGVGATVSLLLGTDAPAGPTN